MVQRAFVRLASGLAVVCLAAGAAQAGLDDVAPQVLIGFSSFDNDELDFSRVTSSDGSMSAAADVSDMPTLGLAAQLPLQGCGATTFGLESGALIGWRSDRDSVPLNSASDALSIDVSWTIIDLSFGLFINQNIGDGVRLYGGAGPYAMTGWMDRETYENTGSVLSDLRSDDSSTIFGYGVYGRAGIEFRVNDGWFGIGGRLLSGELDFDGDAEDADADAAQAFLTYTANW